MRELNLSEVTMVSGGDWSDERVMPVDEMKDNHGRISAIANVIDWGLRASGLIEIGTAAWNYASGWFSGGDGSNGSAYGGGWSSSGGLSTGGVGGGGYSDGSGPGGP